MKKFGLAIASGLLLFAAFPPLTLWPAAFLGAGLLFFLLADEKLSRRFLLALLAGGAFFAPLLHWSSIYVGALPWLILALGESLLFSLIALAPIKRGIYGAILFASSFTLIELLRMKAPFGGFGWGRIGFTQVDSLQEFYPIIGVVGVSFIVLSLSALVIVRPRLLFVLISIFALSFFDVHQNTPSGKSLKIVSVQGSVPQLGLEFNQRALAVLNNHIDATPKRSSADLVIWPENASDVDPIANLKARQGIAKLIEEIEKPLLIGAVEQRSSGPLNSSLLYGADGELLSRYVKQDLAPFGEYIPLRSISEMVSPLARQVRDFIPGDNWVKHKVNGIEFQSFICFEVLDDDHIQSGAVNAEFFVAQTNNATFGNSYQAAQQLQITRARAAELSRQFAVVSTTGFTAHIDQNGKVLTAAEPFKPIALEMEIEAFKDRATTLRGSYSWGGILSVLWLLCLFLQRRSDLVYNR
ncbi:MAG: apolipoprotein N-acyltransferase [Actinobacteria bacterium]|nr:apolipoprotein N-acyltransferase [Actinomycetota bacterium]